MRDNQTTRCAVHDDLRVNQAVVPGPISRPSSVRRLTPWLSALLCGVRLATLPAAETIVINTSAEMRCDLPGGDHPFKLRIGGAETDGMVSGGPGCFGSDYAGPVVQQLFANQIYEAYFRITDGTYCGAPEDARFGFSLSSLPGCVRLYLNGEDRGGFWPNLFPAEYLSPSEVQFTAELRRNDDGSSLPVAHWSVKDESGWRTSAQPQGGHYQLSADGMAQAIATVTNTTEPVTFVFTGASLGCTLTNTGGGAVLTAGTNFGTVQVTAQITNADVCLVRDFYFDLIACADCEDCDVQTLNNSVDIRVSLGPSRKGAGRAFLQVKSAVPTAALGTPTLLRCDFIRPEFEKITNAAGGLRQVRALDRVVDILTNSASSYVLKLYDPGALLPKTNGLYQFSTNGLFRSVTVELVGGDTNHVRVTDSLDAAPANYWWETNGWRLVTGGDLRTETRSATQAGAVRTEVRTIKNASGTVVLWSSAKWQAFSFGERLIEEIAGAGANARTNSYTYTSNGLLQQVNREDGSWEIYQYDVTGRQVERFSSFTNSAPTTNVASCRRVSSSYANSVVSGSGDDGTLEPYTPRRVIEYLANEEIRRRYTVVKPGQRIEIECVNPGVTTWSDTGNLFTTNHLRADAGRLGEAWKIVRPDGTMRIMSHGEQALPGSSSPLLDKTTVLSGAPNGSWSDVVAGTRDETWVDKFRRTALQLQTDVASGILLSSNRYFYDARGHLTNTTFLDGTRVAQTYDCCQVQSTTERDGTVTAFTYDTLKRLLTTTRNGITISNVLDADGRVLASVRYGSNGPSMALSQAAYDDAGRQTSATDPLNNTTTFTNYFDGGGLLVRKTSFPDGGTHIENHSRDGSIAKVTGTALFPTRFEYGVENDGGFQRACTKEIKLDANGSDTGEWTKADTDGAGRAYKTVFASASGTPAQQSFFNNKGQPIKVVDPDGVTALFQYNAEGQQEYSVVDVNTNGAIEFGGTDRITQIVSDVITNAVLSANVRRARTFVWSADNANASNLLSTAEASVDGLKTWSTLWNGSVAVTNWTITTHLPASGQIITTNIAPDGSTLVVTNQNGRRVSVTSRDSAGTQLGQTVYGYDAHGRVTAVTDARTGTTTHWFNNADDLSGIATPVPALGQSSQVTTNYFDNMGRVWKTTLPDGTSVTNEFFLTGLNKKTSGARVYPQENTFDPQGRLKTLKTWQNFAANTGTATNTWNYDGYRGFLTNKMYQGNVGGPGYNYTPAGRLRTRTWARGIVITNTYNAAGDLITVGYSDGTPSVTTAYDRGGRPKQITVGAIFTTTLTYNDAGLLLSESYSGGPLAGLTMTNSYDELLRRVTNGLWNGSTWPAQTRYTYDTASRLQTVASGTNTAVYSYLANAPLVEKIFFTNQNTLRMTVTKSHDNLSRLTAVQSSVGIVPVSSFDYEYNLANQRTNVLLTDGSRWKYSYDHLGQVTSGKRAWSDGAPVAGQQFEFTFDDIGNRKLTGSGGSPWGTDLRSANYTNNLLNQITSRDVPGYVNVLGSAQTNATITLWSTNSTPTYTPTSRKSDYFRGEIALNNSTGVVWLTITNVAVLQNGTNADILTNLIGSLLVPKTPGTFSYDADGNLTNDGRFDFTWDGENRLTSMVSVTNAPAPARTKVDCTYDYRRRRTQKIVSTWIGSAYVPQSTNRFVYDGWNLIAILDATNRLDRSFTWGLDLSGTIQGAGGVGGLLAMTVHTGPWAGTYFYCHDGNGNVSKLVSAVTGGVVAEYEYGPFGELLRASGPLALLNPFLFSTKFCDWETGFYYYGFRYYDPGSGRWLSRDPLGENGGMNLYLAFLNNALTYVDRDGRDNWSDPTSGQNAVSQVSFPAAALNKSTLINIGLTANLTIAVGANATWEGAVRATYDAAEKKLRGGISKLVQDGYLTPQEGARIYVEQRNDLIRNTRSRSSPVGRAWAEWLKPEKEFKTCEVLRQSKTDLQIIETAHTRGSVSRGAAIGKGVGKVCLVAGINFTFVDIYGAPPGERGRRVAGSAGGTVGALAVGYTGAEVGAWIGSPGGPLGVGIGAGIGFIGGSIIGGIAGDRAGENYYDAVVDQ